MISLSRYRTRIVPALAVTAALAGLAGCQDHKIIARANGETINDTQFNDYAARVKATDFQSLTQSGVQTDAGGVGLMALVKEKLLEKLATEKKAMPSDEAVKQFIDYQTRVNPNVQSILAAGQLTPDELKRQFRDQMIILNLGTNNDAVSDADLKKTFETNAEQFNIQESTGLRISQVPDETAGIELINKAKASGNFRAEANKLMPGRFVERYFTAATALPPALKTAIATLKDGEFVPAPVKIEGQPGVPPILIVAQLIRKIPAAKVTLAEAHEGVRQRALSESHPQWGQHAQELINDYNSKATIDVYVDRYKEVVKQALVPPPAPAFPQGAPGAPGAGGPPPGAGSAQPGMGASPGGGRVLRPGASAPGSAPAPGGAPAGGGAKPGMDASAPSGAASSPGTGTTSKP